MCACVRACVCACVCACVRACVCVGVGGATPGTFRPTFYVTFSLWMPFPPVPHPPHPEAMRVQTGGCLLACCSHPEFNRRDDPDITDVTVVGGWVAGGSIGNGTDNSTREPILCAFPYDSTGVPAGASRPRRNTTGVTTGKAQWLIAIEDGRCLTVCSSKC